MTAPTQDGPDLPTGLDGRPPRFCWFDPRSDEQVYAATADDLLGEWMPGYLDRDEAGRAEARGRHAAQVHKALTARLAADADDLTDEQRQVLLADPGEKPGIDQWTASVPLVLIDTHYEPHTDRAAPVAGDPADREDKNRGAGILWLRTVEAEAYLLSLAHAGVIRLDVHGEQPAEPGPPAGGTPGRS